MTSSRRQSAVYLVGPERLELRRVGVPRPAAGEILVRIAAATTCGTDVKVYRRGGHPRMLRVPGPFGHEMAGIVEEVGPPIAVAAAGAATTITDAAAPAPASTSWAPGDRVVVANSAPCGQCAWCRRGRENLCSSLQYLNGAFAQFLLVPARFAAVAVHRIAETLPFEVAALAEPLACVLHGLEVAPPEAGCEVAVYGAGPTGLLFVEILVARGHRVVVADPNPGRLAVALQLGASAAVQVSREGGEAERVRRHAASGDGFGLAVECTGSPAAWWDTLATAGPGATCLLFGGCPPGTVVPLDTHRLHYTEQTVKSAYHHRPATFRAAVERLAKGMAAPTVLLSGRRPLAEVEAALWSMMRKEAFKVVIEPGALR